MICKNRNMSFKTDKPNGSNFESQAHVFGIAWSEMSNDSILIQPARVTGQLSSLKQAILENAVPSPPWETHWATWKRAQRWTSSRPMQWGDNKLSHASAVHCCFSFFFCKGSIALFACFFSLPLFQEECVLQTSPLREVFGQALECSSARACVHTLIYVNESCWWPSGLKKTPPPAQSTNTQSLCNPLVFFQSFILSRQTLIVYAFSHLPLNVDQSAKP